MATLVALKTGRGSIRNHSEAAFWRAFRRNMRSARAKTGVSQRVLARAVGYDSVASINNIEHGRQHPDVFRACVIATALGMDISKLVGMVQPPVSRAA